MMVILLNREQSFYGKMISDDTRVVESQFCYCWMFKKNYYIYDCIAIFLYVRIINEPLCGLLI